MVARSDGRGPVAAQARRITVRGIVQGVGFRPHVYALAREHDIRGWVKNAKSGVLVHAEGEGAALDAFVAALKARAPRMAYITHIQNTIAEPAGFGGFEIRPSDGSGARELLISPDVSLCWDCRREIEDPRDRHYHYPFTNCTHCGPRFSIIADLPYDRPHTSMAPFAMCPDCLAAYRDPQDRRFHAQPVACPACGPQVALSDSRGEVLARGPDALHHLGQRLRAGAVAAIRGLGGFHLACDATDADAIDRIRRGKDRPRRPLALMVRDVAVAEEIARLRPGERDALCAPEAPIIIAERRADSPLALAEGLAPGMASIGLMLPYTPLHVMLFWDGPRALVMTSGNRRGMPLITDVAEAYRALGGIADVFLVHDREILRRVDDSVWRFDASSVQRPIPYRRSRGYAPRPLVFRGKAGPAVIGLGPEEKVTTCLLDDDYAFVGPHAGDLTYAEAQSAYREEMRDLIRLLEVQPGVVAHDMHPDYFTTSHAQSLEAEHGLLRVPVGHHHAHLVSCQVENGVDQPTLGIIADGTGYGPDGSLWGMEILYGDAAGYRRLVTLDPVPLIGGERAIQRPLRQALAHLLHFSGSAAADALVRRFPAQAEELRVARSQLEAGIHAPLTSGCGRFFDAVSAYLGLCIETTYGGEPAAVLSEHAGWGRTSLPFCLLEDGEVMRWDLTGFWDVLQERALRGDDTENIAADFHRTVGEMFLAGAHAARERASCTVVALSGGVFQNPTLLAGTVELLEAGGFSVLIHREIPPNDGGISLGQAAVGRVRAAADL